MSRPQDPYAWAETWAWPLIERGDLSSSAGLVLLRLAAHADRDGVARPSARRLAGMIGRHESVARAALNTLRDRGVIEGDPTPRRATKWRLVTDEIEQQHLHKLRTRPPQTGVGIAPATAGPYPADNEASTQTHLRAICVPSAGAYRGEGEVEELPLSPSTDLQHAATRDATPPEPRTQPADEEERDGLVHFNPRTLIQLRRLA